MSVIAPSKCKRSDNTRAAATWASDEPVVDAETKRWYEEGYNQWEVMSEGSEFATAGVFVSFR